jgi:SAM-dependent methyltransferase
MAFSIYNHPHLYRWAMLLAYGKEYAARYAAMADAVGQPSDVLEVCCGDLALYRHLRSRGLVKSYRGLDLAPAMVARARRQGVQAEVCDVRAAPSFPAAEVVAMQASLYQFHEAAASLLKRLWRAAGRALVICEPVRNFSQSSLPLLRWLALLLSRPTDGRDCVFRYAEESLRALYAEAGIPMTTVSFTPTRKEMVIVSRKPSVGQRAC